MFDLVIDYDKLQAMINQWHVNGLLATAKDAIPEIHAANLAIYWLGRDILQEFKDLDDISDDPDCMILSWGIQWTDMTLWLDKRIAKARAFQRTGYSWTPGLSKSQIEEARIERLATAVVAEKLKFELDEMWQKVNTRKNGGR